MEDEFKGYVWPAQRRGVKIPARSEVVIWGRARAGPAGTNYCGLVEALEELNTVTVARTLAIVRNGRLPVRLKNCNNFPVTLGRYQKIGRLYQVDDVDVHGGRDVDLAVDDSGVLQVGLVEALEELNTVTVARTLAIVRNGRLPVRLKNCNNFPVTLGRYQKIGRLYQVDDVDVHGGRDVDLAVDDSGVLQVGLVEAVDTSGEGNGFSLERLVERPGLTPAEAGLKRL
ncbi:uncharacterized protein LOC106941474 [Poecilia latipinna]|uniref:uncharacterized protein LOC106941474 n=1 Tax=Poecilia latipinna TaxID=48699 RepID=UPI00072E2946|nr:PREDICTED: uncharacterized protein LOC106941474 [Poecilia latipinna]